MMHLNIFHISMMHNRIWQKSVNKVLLKLWMISRGQYHWKIQIVGDAMSVDGKYVEKLSSSVQTVVDKLIFDVKTPLEDTRAFNVKNKANLEKKEEQSKVLLADLKVKFSALETQVVSLLQTHSYSTIVQEHVSKALSSVEQSFKSQLAPIHNLVVRLPTNSLCVASHQVSQGGEERSLFGLGFGMGNVRPIGKIFSSTLPTLTIPIQTMATTITTSFVVKQPIQVYISKLLSNKGFMIKPVSASTIIPTNVADKRKGKFKDMSKEER